MLVWLLLLNVMQQVSSDGWCVSSEGLCQMRGAGDVLVISGLPDDGMVTASQGCWGSHHHQLAVSPCGRCSQPPPSHPVRRQQRKCLCLLSVDD